MANLFVDTSTVAGKIGGTGRYTKALAEALSIEHRVIVPDGCWHPDQDQVPEEAINPHKLINFKLQGNALNYSADFSFFPNYFMPPGWPYPAAVTIHDISFITHPHFYSRKMVSWYSRRIRHTLLNARYILTVSQASKQSICNHLNIPSDKVLVHPPAPPLEVTAVSQSAEKKFLLCVGSIEPKKGVLELIHGFNLSSTNHDHTLVFSGKFNCSASFRRRFEHFMANSERVLHEGYLPKEKLTGYYSNTSGLLMLSRIEGFGIPVLDALSNSIPVITSNDPALIEISDGLAASVDPDSPEQISSVITELIDSKNATQTDAFDHVRKHYSLERYRDRILEITDKVLHKPVYSFPDSVYNKETYRPYLLSMPDRDIIAGICYAATFRSGISSKKLYHSLQTRSVSYNTFSKNVTALVRRFPELFSQSGPIFSLKGVSSSASLKFHQNRQLETRKNHHRLIRLLGSLPWIKSLYYSGGTVHRSGFGDDPDLDLMVITKENRAWLTYGLIRLIGKLTGRGGTLCTNYILDRSALKIEWQRDYYTAHQLLFLKEIYRSGDTPHIRYVNRWIDEIFSNRSRFRSEQPEITTEKIGGFLALFNSAVMFLMSRDWKNRGLKSGEGGLLWDQHRIKLHTNDHRPTASKQFEKLYDHCMNVIGLHTEYREKRASGS